MIYVFPKWILETLWGLWQVRITFYKIQQSIIQTKIMYNIIQCRSYNNHTILTGINFVSMTSHVI